MRSMHPLALALAAASLLVPGTSLVRSEARRDRPDPTPPRSPVRATSPGASFIRTWTAAAHLPSEAERMAEAKRQRRAERNLRAMDRGGGDG